MGLLDLPTELILMIEEHLPAQSDVFALIICHSRMPDILQQRLYNRTSENQIHANLVWAFERGNEGLASAMLSIGADMIFTEYRIAPLSMAANYDNLNMVRLVLEHPKTKNKPTSTDNEDATAIMIATYHEHTDTVKLLLAQPHLDPQKTSDTFLYKTRGRLTKDRGGEELDGNELWDIPINQALQRGNPELVRILLADTRVELNSLSLLAAVRGGCEDMIRMCLVQYPQEFDPAHESLLIIATKSNNTSLVKLLLEVAGQTSDMECEIDGKTSFISAASGKAPALDKSLLARNNINANTTDWLGRSPLIFSASHGNIEMMKMLLDTGEVDADSPDGSGRTPLSYAAEAGKHPVTYLLSFDAVNPGSKDGHDMTLLHYAAQCGNVSVMKALLDTGKVDVDFPDVDGLTPLSYAARGAKKGPMKLLLSLDAVNPNSKHACGLTPLHYAAMSGDVAVIKLLLDTGKVDVGCPDNRGITPLSYARDASRYGNKEGMKVLVKAKSRNQGLQWTKTVVFRCKKRGRRAVRMLLNWIS